MWYRMVEWFSDVRERHNLLRDFNKAAKHSFVIGLAPTLLEVRTTVFSGQHRHPFSAFMGGGFKRYKNFRDITAADVPLIKAGILQTARVAEPTMTFKKNKR